MSGKEINVILQKKLANITQVSSQELPYKEEQNYESREEEDIFFSVKPFYLILQLFGLQKISFEPNDYKTTSKAIKVYAFLLAIGVFCIQCYVIYMKFCDQYPNLTPAAAVTDLLSIIPMTLSTIISLIMAATCNQKMILRTLNNFKIIDEKLSIHKQNIYKKLRVKILLMIIVIILGTVGHYVYAYIARKENEVVSAMSLMSIIKELIILELCLLIYIDTTRLEIMNYQLENTRYDISKLFITEMTHKWKRTETIMMRIADKVKTQTKQEFKQSGEEDKVDDLTRLMRIYDRLADNANIVNSCFGIPVLINVYLSSLAKIRLGNLTLIFQLLSAAIAVFINILSTVDSLINSADPKNVDPSLAIGNTVLWCFRDLFFVTLVTVVCERLQSRVKKTSDIINKLSISSKIDIHQQDLLERFSQLIACRKFTITACNFFPFDFTFIYSLVGAVATYTVILLQVSQSNEAKKT